MLRCHISQSEISHPLLPLEYFVSREPSPVVVRHRDFLLLLSDCTLKNQGKAHLYEDYGVSSGIPLAVSQLR